MKGKNGAIIIKQSINELINYFAAVLSIQCMDII